MQQPIKNISENGCYCFTLETIDTVDIFTKPMYKQLIVHSLNHFIDSKGLILYGWCLMSSKLFIICQSLDNASLKDLLKEFTHFTRDKIIETTKEEHTERNDWVLKHFQKPVSLFEDEEIKSCWGCIIPVSQIDMRTPQSMAEQLEFIHSTPVKERIVQYPADYVYSSARDYAGLPGLVKIFKPISIENTLFQIESRKSGFKTNYNMQS